MTGIPMAVTCFWLEPADMAQMELRRYERRNPSSSDDLCPRSNGAWGYHDARGVLGRAPITWTADRPAGRPAEFVLGDGQYGSVDFQFPGHDDPRWPARCECGYEFCASDQWQERAERMYRRGDTGELVTLRDAPDGAMWDATWVPWKGPDGRCLVVKCPGGSDWTIDGRASNCTMRHDTEHRCWVRHGEPPVVTVGKDGLTCQAGCRIDPDGELPRLLEERGVRSVNPVDLGPVREVAQSILYSPELNERGIGDRIMTVIAYDTEFLEDGKTIALISIGMVRDDGAEYYAVNEAASKWRLRRRIRKHPWLMANVVPSLPKAHGDWNLYMPRRWLFNYSDPCVKPLHVIAREVRGFVLERPQPELWADHGAYDHVRLAQLFGPMIDLPAGFPMWTHELRQEAERSGNPDLPRLSGATSGMGEHNALHDAREVLYRLQWLHAPGTARTGLDRVAEAVRAARGGDAPPQIQGFA